MRRSRTKQFRKLAEQIDAFPLCEDAEVEALERFRDSGELPRCKRLALAVTDRALNGGDPRRVVGSVYVATPEEMEMIHAGMDIPDPRESVRGQLFGEAVFGEEVVRVAAQAAVKVRVLAGADPADPGFIDEDMKLPDYGTVGLHLIGFPECIVRPPCECQARRLLDRIATIREQVDRDDRRKMDAMNAAAYQFLHHGELPNDELLREGALANAELVVLLRHRVGHHVAELLDVLDRLHAAERSERGPVIAELQKLALESRFVTDSGSEVKS